MKKILLLCIAMYNCSYSLEFLDTEIHQPQLAGLTSVGDLNGDGYNDIFVSGVYIQFYCVITFTGCNGPLVNFPAQVLINNKKGGFVNKEQDNEIEFTSLTIDDLKLYYSTIADVDNDGDNDVISSDGRIFLNDGTGQLSTPIIAGFIPSVKPILVADFDNDGVFEILNSGKIYKRVQTEPLEYNQSTNTLEWNPNKSIEVADFNHDGYQDILTYGNDEVIEIFLNDTNGGFLTQNLLTSDVKESLGLVVGDIDSDNDVDIVLSSQRVLRNNANNGYVLEDGIDENPIIVPSSIPGIVSDEEIQAEFQHYMPKALIKYNDDDFLDLIIVVEQTENNSTIFRQYVAINDGTGKFNIDFLYAQLGGTPKIVFVSQFYPESTYIEGDYNGDGYEDFIESPSVPMIVDENNYALTNPYFVSLLSYKNPKIHPDMLNLHLNDKKGSLIPSEYNKLINSNTSLIDIDNNGKQELVYMPISDDHAVLSGVDRLFYLSNLKFGGYQLNKFNFFEQLPSNAWDISLQLKDFNNDGLVDAYVTYDYSTPEFFGYRSQIFSNSETGFDSVNVIELEDRTTNNVFDVDIIGDFNGDGKLDILKSKSNDGLNLQFYINGDGQQFQQKNVRIPDLTKTNYGLKSADLNNDGLSDLVFQNSDKTWSVIFGSPDLDNLSVASLISEPKSGSITFFDYNGDGYKDIFIHDQFSTRLLSIYQNNNGDFSLIREYADIQDYSFIQQNHTGDILFSTRNSKSNSFSLYRLLNGRIRLTKTINDSGDGSFYSHRFKDLNNDGELELIACYMERYSGKSEIVVLEQDENGRYAEIYSSYLGLNSGCLGNLSFSDFDDDGLMDFFFQGKAYFARNFSFYTGLHYDSSHNGHGFSLENVGDNQFFTVFYTYDKDGYPEWYTNLGVFGEPQQDYWNIKSEDTYSLVRTEYDYTNNIAVQNTSNSYKGYLSHDSCSETFGEININYEIGVNSYGLPLSKANWCSQPIVDYYLRPHENFSGLWWAGDNDSGWGWSISLVERDDATDMVLVLYYYDAEGNPRWLIGQQSGFVQGQELTIDMNMVKGYSRGSTPTNLTLIPAGTVSITLNQVSHSLSQAGRMSVNVTYPGPEGGSWVRNDIPIALFSSPRN